MGLLGGQGPLNSLRPIPALGAKMISKYGANGPNIMEHALRHAVPVEACWALLHCRGDNPYKRLNSRLNCDGLT